MKKLLPKTSKYLFVFVVGAYLGISMSATYYQYKKGEYEIAIAIVSAFILIIQLLFYVVDYKKRNKRDQIEKAIQMAEVFAAQIIPTSSLILRSMKGAHYSVKNAEDPIILGNKIEEVVEINNVSEFTCEEAISIFGEGDYKTCLELCGNLDQEIRDEILKALNTLEYMCMYFNTNVAAEKAVYQSLHQVFISTIKLLYLYISSKNENNKDKYFTNIIELFNKWNTRDKQNHKREERANRRKEKYTKILHSLFENVGKATTPKV